MTAEAIAVIIAAGTQAATVILGVGALAQKLTDVRDDVREMRTSLQLFLQAQAAMPRPGNPGQPTNRKEAP